MLHALQTVQLTVVFHVVAIVLDIAMLYVMADAMAAVDPWMAAAQIIM